MVDVIATVQVVSYVDVLRGNVELGQSIVIVGAGGIGFDVAEYVTQEGESSSLSIDAFLSEWGIDKTNSVQGGVKGLKPKHKTSDREVTLLQRKKSKFGKGLGKTTGWIHRSSLKHRNVKMIGGITYKSIDDTGLVYEKDGKDHVLKADTIITCAGQESLYELEAPLKVANQTVFRIGGSFHAGELDAKRAIDQGARLAAEIETLSPGDPLHAPQSFSSKVFQFLTQFSDK